MTDGQDRKSSDDRKLEEEIRQARSFTPQEALARMAGPGALKGASPVSQVQQAETEIGNWLTRHLADPADVLQVLLQRQLNGSALLLDNLDQPLIALANHCRNILTSDYLLGELVRQADVEWGQRMDERPIFEKEGSPDQANDPYTSESVRGELAQLVRQLPETTR